MNWTLKNYPRYFDISRFPLNFLKRTQMATLISGETLEPTVAGMRSFGW